MGRKVGVGFNHPMVLGGRCQHHWQTVPGGLVETLRTYRRP
jgi:hypothetical protein